MRIGDSVWHSKRIKKYDAETPEFEKPIEIITRANYLTCVPAVARGYVQVLQYGETISKYWTIIANARTFDKQFKEGDLMWVDGEKPIEHIEQEYGYGASANAIVKSVAKSNHSITILIEYNQNRVVQ